MGWRGVSDEQWDKIEKHLPKKNHPPLVEGRDQTIENVLKVFCGFYGLAHPGVNYQENMEVQRPVGVA